MVRTLGRPPAAFLFLLPMIVVEYVCQRFGLPISERGATYLCIAILMLLAVVAQCLYPPWESGHGVDWCSVGHAPLWAPPRGSILTEDGYETFPVRIHSWLLWEQLFLTGWAIYVGSLPSRSVHYNET